MVNISIKGNKFYLEEDTIGSDDFQPENQQFISAHKKGAKWFVYHDTKGKVYRNAGYDLGELSIDGTNPVATDQELSDWFDANTGNKGAGGGGGATLGQVNTAIANNNRQSIRLDGTATHDDATSEKAVADELNKKIDKPTVTLPADDGKVLAVDATGDFVLIDPPETGNDAAGDWVGGNDYTGANNEVFYITPTQLTPIDGDGNTLVTGEPVLMRYKVGKVANATLTLAEILLMEKAASEGSSTIVELTDVDDTDKAEFFTHRVDAAGNHIYVDDRDGRIFIGTDAEWNALSAFEQSRYDIQFDFTNLIVLNTSGSVYFGTTAPTTFKEGDVWWDTTTANAWIQNKRLNNDWRDANDRFDSTTGTYTNAGGGGGGPADTDALAEGATNLYYTEGRVSANADVAANTAKTGISTQQAADITANNAKTSYTDAAAVAANTAKGDYTAAAIAAVAANTLKNDYPTADSDKVANLPADQNSINTAKADLVGGLVPAGQLPSYVDDVLEFADLASFPASGEAGKIYTALDTNKIYRWSGTVYVEISEGALQNAAEVPYDNTASGLTATETKAAIDETVNLFALLAVDSPLDTTGKWVIGEVAGINGGDPFIGLSNTATPTLEAHITKYLN